MVAPPQEPEVAGLECDLGLRVEKPPQLTSVHSLTESHCPREKQPGWRRCWAEAGRKERCLAWRRLRSDDHHLFSERMGCYHSISYILYVASQMTSYITLHHVSLVYHMSCYMPHHVSYNIYHISYHISHNLPYNISHIISYITRHITVFRIS